MKNKMLISLLISVAVLFITSNKCYADLNTNDFNKKLYDGYCKNIDFVLEAKKLENDYKTNIKLGCEPIKKHSFYSTCLKYKNDSYQLHLRKLNRKQQSCVDLLKQINQQNTLINT